MNFSQVVTFNFQSSQIFLIQEQQFLIHLCKWFRLN